MTGENANPNVVVETNTNLEVEELPGGKCTQLVQPVEATVIINEAGIWIDIVFVALLLYCQYSCNYCIYK